MSGNRRHFGTALPAGQASQKVQVAVTNALVDLGSVSDLENDDHHQSVLDPVDDPIVSNPHSIEVVIPTQLLATAWSWLTCQQVDLLGYLGENAPIDLL